MPVSVGQAPIPFVDLQSQYRQLKDEINTALTPVFESTGFIMGPPVQEFEDNFAKFIEADHCVTVHSGTAALHLALMALGIGPGHEVITVPNTFIATCEAISFVGATPRFVDVDPETYNMDVTQLESAITPATKAIIPVHLYGQPADMDSVMDIARRHGLKVVEDACQAHGARYKGRRAGTIGDAGCFSFYPGKNLGAAGEGGAVVTNKQETADAIRLIRDHGSPKKYEHKVIGHNFRLDTLQAAVLNVKLPHLEDWNASRQRRAQYYSDRLSKISGVTVPALGPDRDSVFHLYVVQVDGRQSVQEALSAANIHSGIHYPVPIHLQEAYKHLGHGKGDFPVAEMLSRRILSLPVFPEITEAQQNRVVKAIAGAL